MNRKKIGRLVRDLQSMTPLEAMSVIGRLNRQCGVVVTSTIIDLLQRGSDNPETASAHMAGGNLWLMDTGEKKIQVIKAIREHFNLGLKEAKLVADNAPLPLHGAHPFLSFDLVTNNIHEAQKGLEAAGAKVEFK